MHGDSHANKILDVIDRCGAIPWSAPLSSGLTFQAMDQQQLQGSDEGVLAHN
ncbi:hypothetical protein PISMIDRAFT_9623 [Pisolithus microcarpus 441]|uniref:Uncharacterized protein n=1 Tax=Pisolithus microcarpus 441 TaxID=765257 RepID=A0A0C9Z7V7_9AGAM|nr:hypothetical protein PISMIDRAFT_9623 [Pisolithus microcarpus 441]